MRRFVLAASSMTLLILVRSGVRPAASLGNIGKIGHFTFDTGAGDIGFSVQSGTLAAAVATLLPKLISGEPRMKYAERAMEATA